MRAGRGTLFGARTGVEDEGSPRDDSDHRSRMSRYIWKWLAPSSAPGHPHLRTRDSGNPLVGPRSPCMLGMCLHIPCIFGYCRRSHIPSNTSFSKNKGIPVQWMMCVTSRDEKDAPTGYYTEPPRTTHMYTYLIFQLIFLPIDGVGGLTAVSGVGMLPSPA